MSFSPVTKLTPGANITLDPASGQGIVEISSTALQADWPVGSTTRRYFLIDGVNGSDDNPGFTDTMPADPATIAKKTVAGFAAIFPPIGAGRTAEIIVSVGTTITGIDNTLRNASGYGAGSLLRATGTNATAGATAFTGDLADLTYQGFVTAAGMNAAGYNPTVTGTFAIGAAFAVQQVGGAAPAFPAETALPLGARARFDAATTTVANRNKVFPIIAVPGTGQLAFGLAVTVALTDVFYIETPGLTVGAMTFGAIAAGGTALTLSGISMTSLTIRNGQYLIAGCTLGSLSSTNNAQIFYVTGITSALGTIVVGGTRVSGNTSHTSGLLSMATGAVVTGSVTTSSCWSVSIPDDVVIGSYVPRGGAQDIVNNGFNSIGGVTRPTRIIGNGGAAIRPFSAQLAILKCTIGPNAQTWLYPDGMCRINIMDAVTGSVADRGIDLTDSFDTKIHVYQALPTVTDVNGNIMMRVSTAGASARNAFAPYSTLTVAKLGGITDGLGNEIINSFEVNTGAFVPRKVPLTAVLGVTNTSGADIPQFSVVRIAAGGPTATIALADTAAHAQGLLGFLYTTCLNGGYGLVALHGDRLPVTFDAVPTAGQVVYLSDLNPGQVTVTAPANARVLGNVITQSDNTNVSGFLPRFDVLTIAYDTIAAAGVSLTKRTKLNFSSNFATTDNSGAARTDVELGATAVTPGSYAYASLTVDAKGRITAAANGAAPTTYTFSTGLTNTAGTITANISTGIAGGQTAKGGTASGENLTLISNTSNDGRIIFGSTSGLVYNESTKVLTIGVSGTPITGSAFELAANVNGAYVGFLSNSAVGGAAYAGLVLTTDPSTGYATPYFGNFLYGKSYTTSGNIKAGTGQLEVGSGTGNLIIDVAQASGDIIVAIGGIGSTNERLRIANSTLAGHVTWKNVPFVSYTSASTAIAQSAGTVQEFGQVPPTLASGASIKLDAYKFDAVTVTFTGTTGITTATGVNFIDVEIPTYTDASALTITNAATLTIKGAPAASGSLTITNPYALWVQAGNVRLDSLGTGLVKATSGVLSIDSTTYITGSLVATNVLYASGASTVAQDSRFAYVTGSGVLSVPAINTNTVTATTGDLLLSATAGGAQVSIQATTLVQLVGTSYQLSGLTSNGFVKTSGGGGALSIDTTAYLSGTLTAGRVPFASGPSTLTDSANLTFTVGTGVLQAPLFVGNTLGGFGGGGVLTLENNHATPATSLSLSASGVTINTGFTYEIAAGAVPGSKLTLGVAGSFGSGGVLQVNTEDNYISLGASVKAGLYVASSYPQYSSIVADMGYFGASIVGYYAQAMSDLTVAAGGSNILHLGYGGDAGPGPSTSCTDVITIDGTAGSKLSFYAASPVAQQTVTGSRGGNAALADLLTKLAAIGLIVDASTP